MFTMVLQNWVEPIVSKCHPIRPRCRHLSSAKNVFRSELGNERLNLWQFYKTKLYNLTFRVHLAPFILQTKKHYSGIKAFFANKRKLI